MKKRVLFGVLVLGVMGLYRCGAQNNKAGSVPSAERVVKAEPADVDPVATNRVRNLAEVDRVYKANKARFEKDADKLVLPGLLADRKTKTVYVDVETTGLEKEKEVEFVLIGLRSGHAYESVLISFAMPSDIHKALEFIGMKAGRTLAPERLAFWPKGERVILSLRNLAAPSVPAIRLERLLLDRRTQKTLPEVGYAFTGSRLVELEQARDGNRYGADVFEPNSIISIYNEPSTVLDVPRQASKKQVYGSQVVGPDGALPAEKIMQLVIEPEYRDGKLRVKDCILDIGAGADGKAASLGEMSFSLKDVASGQAYNKEPGLNSALEAVSGLTTNGHDVYAVMTFDNRLPLRLVRDACRLANGVETEKGIRVEPPPAGQLYYRAFLPDETMRVRANRVNGQPWELRLTKTGTSVSGTVTRIEEVWPDEGAKPNLVPTDYAAAAPEAVVQVLREKGPGLPVILVFAAPELTYGELMRFVGPCVKTHGMIFVYLDEPAAVPAKEPAGGGK